MRFQRFSAIGALALVAVVAVATLSPAAGPDASGGDGRAGIDADTVDGHHAGASDGSKAQRANRVLWASSRGKLSKHAMPLGQLDKLYLSAKEDTFIYVPGSLLDFHWDDGANASVRINNTGQAIIRPTSTGRVDVIIPIPLEAQMSGHWVRLVNMRVYYKVDNAASYIDHTWIGKINATGGHIDLGTSSGNQTSTTFTSYIVDCSDPGCQLSWPTGGFVTADLALNFGGTGDPHDITISGVLMRVSYDG